MKSNKWYESLTHKFVFYSSNCWVERLLVSSNLTMIKKNWIWIWLSKGAKWGKREVIIIREIGRRQEGVGQVESLA